MKSLIYIIAAIVLFFTAPIWVPAVGDLGLATGSGAATAIVAATMRRRPRRATQSSARRPRLSPLFTAAPPDRDEALLLPSCPPPAAEPVELWVGRRSPRLATLLGVGREGA